MSSRTRKLNSSLTEYLATGKSAVIFRLTTVQFLRSNLSPQSQFWQKNVKVNEMTLTLSRILVKVPKSLHPCQNLNQHVKTKPTIKWRKRQEFRRTLSARLSALKNRRRRAVRNRRVANPDRVDQLGSVTFIKAPFR